MAQAIKHQIRRHPIEQGYGSIDRVDHLIGRHLDIKVLSQVFSRRDRTQARGKEADKVFPAQEIDLLQLGLMGRRTFHVLGRT